MACLAAASSTTSLVFSSSSRSSRLLIRTLTLRPALSPPRLSFTTAVPLRSFMARATLGFTHPSIKETPKLSFTAKDTDAAEWKGDLLAVAVTEKDVARDGELRFQNPILSALDSKLGGLLADASFEEDFTGKVGQSTVLRIAAGIGSKRVALLGLGASASGPAAFKSLGEAVAAAAKSAQAVHVAVVLASSSQQLSSLNTASAIATGTVLGTFEDTRYKTESKKSSLKSVDIIGLGTGSEVEKKLKYAGDISSGILLGRELVNSPPNVLTPGVLAEEASTIALRARDLLRHRRILQSSNGVVDFDVHGTFDPFQVGLYFTKVQLGTPPVEFYVQIDTGSDVLWVSCSSCTGCPQTSGLQIELNFFDTGRSSTSSLISCSDKRCNSGIQSSDATCSSQNNQCSYTFQYGDGSGTSGYYVSDTMHLDTIFEGSVATNSSAPVVFGCSNQQSGDLTKSDRAVDGIFGFGQQEMSVISQLSSQGIAPRVFSHCLRGDSTGGGVLVLGEIVEPNIVYTPLVPSQPHYNLNLQSISVNGQALQIDASVFATSSNNRGTIVDSGTTLAYLAEEAYDPFLNAITATLPQSVRTVVSRGNQCFLITSSVADIFPQVSLNFAGGASMVLRPQDYLIQQSSVSGAAVWCIGFQKIQGQGVTILGDLVLKDKIIVYDLAGQRIGWANYDCSLSVNVSAATGTGRSEYVNAGEISGSTSLHDIHKHPKTVFLSLFVALICCFVFL